MSFTPYLENKLLAHVLANTAYTAPTTLYVSLWNGDPLSGGTEVTGTGYARQSAAFSVTASAGANTNNVEFQADSVWGTVNYAGIHDAITGGNTLIAANLQQTRTIADSDIVRFSIGDIDVTLT
tara:strand:- start:1333 stop:1704 length:372 start_codon:yes stop_codon:yes gene_type:complete